MHPASGLNLFCNCGPIGQSSVGRRTNARVPARVHTCRFPGRGLLPTSRRVRIRIGTGRAGGLFPFYCLSGRHLAAPSAWSLMAPDMLFP